MANLPSNWAPSTLDDLTRAFAPAVPNYAPAVPNYAPAVPNYLPVLAQPSPRFFAGPLTRPQLDPGPIVNTVNPTRVEIPAMNVAPPTAPPSPPSTPSSPTTPPSGAGNLYQQRLAAQRAAAGASGTPSGTGAAGGGSGAGTSAGSGASSGGPRPYSAFRGANPFNVRGALSSTGSIGARLPGFMTTPIPGIAQTRLGGWLPGFATNNLSGARGMGAGMGTMFALGATPGIVANAMGADPNSQGAQTGQAAGTLASLGLFGGVPVAAAAGVGGALGDAAASTDFVRDNVINNIRGALGWAPTDSTLLGALGNIPGIGDWFGGGDEQPSTPEATGPQPLPPTVESIAATAPLAGLDAESTAMLQQQFRASVAVSQIQYQVDPEGFAKAFKEQYGRDFQGPQDIDQVVFQQIMTQALPSAVENQSARAAMLANAAQYQDLISQHFAPIQSQYQDLAARASALGYEDMALGYEAQAAATQNQLRSMPSLAALQQYQSQIDQLSQQQMAQAMSGGASSQSPFDDAATLEALLAGAGQ